MDTIPINEEIVYSALGGQVTMKGKIASNVDFHNGYRGNASLDRAYVKVALRGETFNNYITVVAFNNTARVLQTFSAVGKEIVISGTLRYNEHISGAEVVAKEISFLKKEKLPLSMEEAYEQNKTAAYCTSCGGPLKTHTAVSVRYCKCVEGLFHKDTI